MRSTGWRTTPSPDESSARISSAAPRLALTSLSTSLSTCLASTLCLRRPGNHRGRTGRGQPSAHRAFRAGRRSLAKSRPGSSSGASTGSSTRSRLGSLKAKGSSGLNSSTSAAAMFTFPTPSQTDTSGYSRAASGRRLTWSTIAWRTIPSDPNIHSGSNHCVRSKSLPSI